MESPVAVALGTGSGPRSGCPRTKSRTTTTSVVITTAATAKGAIRTIARAVPAPASFFFNMAENIAYEKGRAT